MLPQPRRGGKHRTAASPLQTFFKQMRRTLDPRGEYSKCPAQEVLHAPSKARCRARVGCYFLSAPCYFARPGSGDRLLSAELLEVSTGDLEKAIAAFQALGADEKAPRAVRAKALLGQARCQRKLGRLEAAKRTLDELVAAPEQDPEVLRQAKSYLKELTGSRSENPDFDWIREIEKNPEVQARIFDWAMKLAGTQVTEINAARRQLLALGTIALPVVEKLLDASREPLHRQQLAIIAVQGGRLERLAVLLDPSQPPELGKGQIAEGIGDICRRLSSSPDGDPKRALAEIAKGAKKPGHGSNARGNRGELRQLREPRAETVGDPGHAAAPPGESLEDPRARRRRSRRAGKICPREIKRAASAPSLPRRLGREVSGQADRGALDDHRRAGHAGHAQ
jgi:tetratricopeptide (TPR) repeat protein